MSLPPDRADVIPSLLRALAGAESLSEAVASVPGLSVSRARELLAWTAEVLEEVDISVFSGEESEEAPVPAQSKDRGLVRIFTDGAARGNPGLAGAGALLLAEDGSVIEQAAEFLGEATNNVAEYQAVLLGIGRAKELGATSVELMSDSELLVRQLSGRYKVRAPHLIPLFEKARRLLEGFESYKVRHVRREKNTEADKLANLAIDERPR